VDSLRRTCYEHEQRVQRAGMEHGPHGHGRLIYDGSVVSLLQKPLLSQPFVTLTERAGGRLREALVGVSPNVDIDGHKLVWSPPSVVERLEHLLGDVTALGDAAVQPALLVVRLVGLGGVRRAREDARLRPAVRVRVS